MQRIFLSFITSALALAAFPQAVSFPDDDIQRGWFDRPWQRYEAEPDLCEGEAQFLLPPDDYSQLPLQSEASNLTAAILHDSSDYLEWRVDKPGRGLTLRFSIPDAAEGGGREGRLLLSVDGKALRSLDVSSHWAWQYTQIAYASEKYPDNSPSADKFSRMRFDEAYFLLDEDIPAGALMRLSKADEGDEMDYCIDFLELEPVAPALSFEDIEATDKVAYNGEGTLAAFIGNNGGKTIYIPAGTYDMPRRLMILTPGTHLVGAGLWYTRLYFSTPSDSRSGYSARGIECNVNDVVVEGMSLDTSNDKRYFDNNPSYQVGKGFNGSWGKNSLIRDVRVDHFECGGWFTGADGLTIERCRFRNNYADGVNLAGSSSRCRVSRCSFRNNGDDDMASWSTGSYATDNEFSYCTAENNWRASSLGFFGGCRGRAHHIAIMDAMEAGARVVCDFAGTGFSTDGYFELSDITIRRSGARQGTPGTQGGFWGDSAASLQIGAGWAYDINNLRISDVDIYDSRFDAVSIKSQSGKSINNLELGKLGIYGVDGYCYGVNISAGVKGNGTYGEIESEGVMEPVISAIPSGFDFVSSAGVEEVEAAESEGVGEQVVVYNLSGRRYPADSADEGIRIICSAGSAPRKIMGRHRHSMCYKAD